MGCVPVFMTMKLPFGRLFSSSGDKSARSARAWAESRERTKLAQEAPKSQAEVEELYKRQREARRAYERVQSRNLLTDEDERILDRLLRGELAPEDIQDRENARSILNVYEAKADYAALTAWIARTITQRWQGRF